jgi:hypothetical protein
VTLLDSDHYLRNVGRSKIDGTTVDGSAFRLRAEDIDGLSGNWQEYFGDIPIEDVLNRIRAAYAAKQRAIGATSKFVCLNIGITRRFVKEKTKVEISFNHTPDMPHDPSHASILGYNPGDDIVADRIAQTVQALFPGRG